MNKNKIFTSCLKYTFCTFTSQLLLAAKLHMYRMVLRRNELIYILSIFLSEHASSVSQLLSLIVPLVVIMAPSLITM